MMTYVQVSTYLINISSSVNYYSHGESQFGTDLTRQVMNERPMASIAMLVCWKETPMKPQKNKWMGMGPNLVPGEHQNCW